MALLKYLCSRLFTTANVDTPGRHHRGDFNPMARPSIDAESLSGSKHYVIAFPSPADKSMRLSGSSPSIYPLCAEPISSGG